MGENSKLGVGFELVLVMHLMTDGYRCALHSLGVCGTRIVDAEGPLAVFIKFQRQAGNASASGTRTNAVQAYGFKFLNGLLGAVHSSLLSASKAMSGGMFQQGRAA